jgi:hypothetical protein
MIFLYFQLVKHLLVMVTTYINQIGFSLSIKKTPVHAKALTGIGKRVFPGSTPSGRRRPTY